MKIVVSIPLRGQRCSSNVRFFAIVSDPVGIHDGHWPAIATSVNLGEPRYSQWFLAITTTLSNQGLVSLLTASTDIV